MDTQTTSKAKILATGDAVLTMVGGFVAGDVVNSQEIDSLKDESNKWHSQAIELTLEKQHVLDLYLYSQLTSGRTPDLFAAPSDEISQAYVNLVDKNDAVVKFDGNGDVAKFIKDRAAEKGELLICK